jgi:hypothetical protein
MGSVKAQEEGEFGEDSPHESRRSKGEGNTGWGRIDGKLNMELRKAGNEAEKSRSMTLFTPKEVISME